MNLQLILTERFVNHIVATKEGRAHLLTQLADAEGGEGGELMVFEALLAYVKDEKLQQLIKIHQDDELRHEALFRGRAESTGVPLAKIPDDQKLLLRIDAEIGLFNRAITSDDAVLRAYLALLVIEERAMSQFTILARAFRRVGDEETAVILEDVARDEERHLKYCHAITKRYAENETVRLKMIDDMRALEARVFAENGRANMRFVLGKGFLPGGLVGSFWRFLMRVNETRKLAAPRAIDAMLAQGLAAPA